MAPLIIATRGSALALRQVDLVVEALRAAVPGIELETRVIRTEGDRDQTTPLEVIGGQGVFVKDIERALLAGEAHIAVHSLKDMPAQPPEGLTIGAVLHREDPRDVLISRDGASIADLGPGARIGTDSRRRAVQLLALRPDLEVVSIRGNVDSRLRKVDEGEYDGVVLAAAGLERLGLSHRVSHTFETDEMLPAVGQGVIAIQCRSDDAETRDLLRKVDHAPTRAAITAERAFLRRLGSGCRLPVGAYAELNGTALNLRAFVADDAGRMHKGRSTAVDRVAEITGRTLAERLLMAVEQAGSAATLDRR
ncbi:MAG TPA: hydroxymethylbilane synthase [Dehalococcoidia bacterium]|nr:hydroxymethylbilane synthase [Dehalococcoidia bacterium]